VFAASERLRMVATFDARSRRPAGAFWVATVAIAKDHPRFVVALDSGEVLLCEFAA
jgi:hypothetical protein